MLQEKTRLEEKDLQLDVEEKTWLEEKEDLQLDVEEKTQRKRRRIAMIVIAIILALAIIIVPTAYFVMAWKDCPYTKQDCMRPEVTQYWHRFQGCVYCEQ
ncbi:MAG: hypothetical protein MUD14_29970 [Hydrococcus sp. Prado102]|jgi:hypothetical protein|nr:hypothetical protein [Hydrococcus sp. Prado102]